MISVQLLDNNAKVPTRANINDAGWDLYSTSETIIPPKQRKTVNTGIALEMPEHMAGLIWPRSGLSVKQMDMALPTKWAGVMFENCAWDFKKSKVLVMSISINPYTEGSPAFHQLPMAIFRNTDFVWLTFQF
jgi:hypothetical protein